MITEIEEEEPTGFIRFEKFERMMSRILLENQYPRAGRDGGRPRQRQRPTATPATATAPGGAPNPGPSTTYYRLYLLLATYRVLLTYYTYRYPRDSEEKPLTKQTYLRDLLTYTTTILTGTRATRRRSHLLNKLTYETYLLTLLYLQVPARLGGEAAACVPDARPRQQG